MCSSHPTDLQFHVITSSVNLKYCWGSIKGELMTAFSMTTCFILYYAHNMRTNYNNTYRTSIQENSYLGKWRLSFPENTLQSPLWQKIYNPSGHRQLRPQWFLWSGYSMKQLPEHGSEWPPSHPSPQLGGRGFISLATRLQNKFQYSLRQ